MMGFISSCWTRNIGEEKITHHHHLPEEKRAGAGCACNQKGTEPAAFGRIRAWRRFARITQTRRRLSRLIDSFDLGTYPLDDVNGGFCPTWVSTQGTVCMTKPAREQLTCTSR